MIPINNSDTAWLIVTDYNQDNNLPYEELREDILNPNVNDWWYEYRSSGIIGGINEGHYVGSDAICGNAVGNMWQVGSQFDPMTGVYPSHLVGGINTDLSGV